MMLTAYVLTGILSAWILFECASLTLSMRTAPFRIRARLIKRILNRLVFIALIMVLGHSFLREDIEVFPLWVVMVLPVYVLLIEALYGLIIRTDYKRTMLNALGVLAFYISIVILFASAKLVFFVLVHPLIVLGAMGLIGLVVYFVLFPRTVRKLSNKFRMVPYRHGLPETFFKEIVKSESVYMIDSRAVSLGLNAMLLDVGNHRHMFVSRPLLASMSYDMVVGILSHEVAHAYEKHMFKRIMVVIPVVMMYFIANFIIFALAFETLSDIAFWVPVVLFNVILIRLGTLVFLGLLQKQEFAADRFAIEEGYGEGLSKALEKLHRQTDDKYYHPLYARLFRSHPSIKVRLKRF